MEKLIYVRYIGVILQLHLRNWENTGGLCQTHDKEEETKTYMVNERMYVGKFSECNKMNNL